MTSRRDIGQANKRRRLERAARELADEDPEFHPSRPPGWRTRYPQEFPVTVTRIGDPRPDAALKVVASLLGISPFSPGMRRLAAAIERKDDDTAD